MDGRDANVSKYLDIGAVLNDLYANEINVSIAWILPGDRVHAPARWGRRAHRWNPGRSLREQDQRLDFVDLGWRVLCDARCPEAGR